MKRLPVAVLLLGLSSVLAACTSPYEPTLRPDYSIRVIPTKQGGLAIPPECPSWAEETADPFDNQPLPQFGCASARNLAAMVEKPEDLVIGRKLDNARGVLAVGAVRRYDNNQTRGLVMPGPDNSQVAITTAPTAASEMTGDVTAGGSSSSTSMTVAP